MKTNNIKRIENLARHMFHGIITPDEFANKAAQLDIRFQVFNTKRGYSDHGQRIAAALVDDLVYMADFDRGLSYVYSCGFNKRSIMLAYDHNQYLDHYGQSWFRLLIEHMAKDQSVDIAEVINLKQTN